MCIYVYTFTTSARARSTLIPISHTFVPFSTTTQLRPPRKYNLEEAMAYILEDEMLEVTPTAIRMRKKELDTSKRARASRDKNKKHSA